MGPLCSRQRRGWHITVSSWGFLSLQCKAGLKTGGHRVDWKLVAAKVPFPAFQSLPALSGALHEGKKSWAGHWPAASPGTDPGWAGTNQFAKS